MTDKSLSARIAALESDIVHSDPRTRAEAAAELGRLVQRLRTPARVTVARTKRPARMPGDEELEALFDNLPV